MRRQRIAARRLHPALDAAAAKFGAERIAARDRDDDVQDHGQNRTQQELDVIEGRIGQDKLFDDERAGRIARRTATGGR